MPQEQFIISRKNSKKQKKKRVRITSILAICLILLLLPILFFNVNIIIKGILNPDEVPMIFGISPMVVLTDSMNTGNASITAGDMIFAKSIETNQLKEDDIILFKEGNGLVIHRIIKINDVDGQLEFTTKGDANNVEDINPVVATNVVGIYLGRIPIIGHFVLFLKTPLGMLLCIGMPLVLFLVYDNIQKEKDRIAYQLELAKLQEHVKQYEDENLTKYGGK